MSADPTSPSPLDSCALARVLRWHWRLHLDVLLEDALHGPLGPREIERRLALGALDLAGGLLLAEHATSRERRRRAAEALTGGAMLALLSPHGQAEPEALAHLEVARRGFQGKGVAWAGLLRFAARAHHPEASAAERAAAGVARWASHLALGDPAAECGRLAFASLAQAFPEAHATEGLSVALAHLERTLSDREIGADALASLVARDAEAGLARGKA